MEGKTNKRFDGLVQKLRDPVVRQKAGRFSALTSVILILVALIGNSAFPRTILGEAGSASATRLWSGGAELQTTTAGVETDTNDGSSFSISTSIKRSGAASWRINGSNSAHNKYFLSTPTQGKFWTRIYVYIATAPSAQIGILRYNGAGVELGVRMNTDGTLELWNEEGSAQIGSDSTALSTATWYRIELYGDTTTLSTSHAELRLNGVKVASTVDSGTVNLAAAFDRIQFGILGTATVDLHFDDIAINDSTGRAADNWPGEGKIVHMKPNATGANPDWGRDWSVIDEVTPNDTDGANLDFIYSQTQNQIEDVNLESASSALIGANDKIKLVSVGARVSACGTADDMFPCTVGESNINYSTRITAGGNTDETQISILDSTGWTTNDDGLPKLNATTAYDLPGSSTTAWTASNLDSAEIGVKNFDSSGVGFRVSTLWLQVEYVDLSGGRIWSSGFELQSVDAGEEYTASIGTTPVVDTTNERSGAAALQTSASAATSGWEYDFASANTTADYYFRAYIRVATAPGTLTNIMEFYDSANSVQASIRMNTDRTLELWNDEDSAQITPDSSAIALNTWVRLEMRLNTVPSGGSQILDARIDGVSFASSSTINHDNGVMTLRAGVLTSTTADFSWDDVALNQAIGTNQNTWPGEGKIIHLRPNAAGSSANWTQNGTCTGGNHGCVNETTPNDATNFVSETTSGDIDDYNIDDSPIGASDTVNMVSVGVRFNSASATQEDFRVRLKDAAAGVAIESNTLSPASTTWTTNATVAPKNYPLTAYTRPEQDSVWLDAQLDTAQIGVRDVLSGTGTAQVSTLWLLVDYTPPLFTISGTCDAFDQTTDCIDDGANSVAVAVDGTLQGQSDATVDGAWSITGVTQPATGAVITVFINGESTPDERAVAVTKYDGTGDITGVKLFHRHLTIGSDDNQIISNADLSSYDNSVSGDADIFFDVSAGNDLTVDTAAAYTDERLFIVTGNTYRPASAGGGDVNTTHIEIDGTFQADSNAINVFGNWQNDGIFTAGTSSVTMTSTTTGRTLSGTMTGASAFHNLTFNGVSGAWGFSSAVAAGNDFTVTNGAVTATNNNLTVTRDFTLANTVGVSYTPGSGGVTVSRHYNDVGNKYVRGTSLVTLNGSGNFNTTNAFTDISFGFTTFTTTLNTSNFSYFGTMTFNGGTVSASGGGWIDIRKTASSTPIVFAAATSLTGTKSMYHRNEASAITTTIAGGNYGSWNIIPIVTSGSSTSSTFELGGAVTTTNNIALQATVGSANNVFNTLNQSITAGMLDLGSESRTATWTVNWGSTTASFSNTGNALAVVSNGGAHTFNLSTSSISTAGSIRFANGTGTIAASGTTSTITMTPAAAATRTFTTNGQTIDNFTVNGGAGSTAQLDGNLIASDDVTITAGTLDVTTTPYHVTIGGNYSNSGTFTARTGTVTFNGTSTQTLSGTMTTTSAFYDLTITNNSGASASDCELTGFTASVDFAASATVTNNYTITTANVRVEYNSGSIYTITNINWNGQASGTRLYFRNSAASGTWLLNVSGTQTAVSYINVSRSDASSGNQIISNDGTNVDCNNNTNWLFNTAPNAPTALLQKRVTAGTTISTGDWTNETQVLFQATATDTDNPDTLQLCVEKDILGTGFSNTEDACGTGVAYSGTGVTVTVTITSQTDASEYHWQARVKDASGAYSSWVSYPTSLPNAESERDYGIDTTACTYGGLVYDGTVEDTDAAYNDSSLTSLSANWDAFTCTVSGLNKYQYSIGTSAGGTQILGWTDNSTTESVTATGLVLRTNQTYFVNVRAVDNAANTSSVTSSNGQDVLPTISMSLSTNSLTFATLTGSNDRSDTKTVTTTSSTNGYSGYVIRQYAAGLLTAGSFTIPMFSAGSYASPASWPAGACSGTTCGYGYTCDDTTIQGSNKFSSGTLYAPFATAAFGDIVADHTANVDGSTGAVVNEQFTITHKVAVDNLQAAQSYTTTVYYIITGLF